MESLGGKLFKVGDKVSVQPPLSWPMKPCKGRLVYIFEAGKTPDEELIRIFYEIDENHKYWWAINRACKVNKYVIHKEGIKTGFVILPEPTLYMLKPY